MLWRIYFRFASLCFAGVLLGGCATAGSAGGKPAKVAREEEKPVSRVDPYATDADERRAEAHARYAAAVVHDWNDETELATEDYYLAALSDPASETLVLEVSQRLLEAKENDKALEVLTKAAAQRDASGLIFAQLARVDALVGRKESAIAANRIAIKKSPRALVGYRQLAQLQLQNKQGAQGVKVLDQAARQKGVDAAFLIELSELYTGFGRALTNQTLKPRALEMLDRAAALDTANPFLLQKLADGFMVLGASDKATVYYLKLLEQFPALPGLREKLAEIYLKKQDREKASEQFEAIIRESPTNPQAYYFLGLIAEEKKKYEEAKDYFNKTILLSPNFEQAYYDMAGAQINLKQPREALTTLDRARAKFPLSFSGELFTAIAYTHLQEYSNSVNHLTAAEVIARASSTNGLDHLAYFRLGSAYERNQRYDEAEANFKRCLERAPDFAEALNYLGYMWAERGVNLPQAKELVEKALKVEPNNAAYLDSLGWVLFKLGRADEALPWMLKAVEHSDEPDATLFDHLGDIYASLKQGEKAREAWRKSLAIERNEEIVKKLDAEPVSGTAPR